MGVSARAMRVDGVTPGVHCCDGKPGVGTSQGLRSSTSRTETATADPQDAGDQHTSLWSQAARLLALPRRTGLWHLGRNALPDENLELSRTVRSRVPTRLLSRRPGKSIASVIPVERINMRTRLAAAAFAGCVVFAPAAAMADSGSSTTVASMATETNQNGGDGDSGRWGLLGLLGLAGLAGLKKRNDDTRSHDDRSTARR